MKLKLPDSVSSSQDIQALITEVREYAKWYTHAIIKQRVELKNTLPAPVMSPVTVEVITKSGPSKPGKPLSQENLDNLIADLEEFRDTAAHITITLAAPVTGEIKRTLTAWCRDNISTTALVSFQFNSTLLGGMVLRYGSRIFDWSFRRQILNDRERFPEVLRNVR